MHRVPGGKRIARPTDQLMPYRGPNDAIGTLLIDKPFDGVVENRRRGENGEIAQRGLSLPRGRDQPPDRSRAQ
jgi:hypothetical protein